MDTIKYKASYKLEPYSYCRSSFYDIFPAQMVRFIFCSPKIEKMKKKTNKFTFVTVSALSAYLEKTPGRPRFYSGFYDKAQISIEAWISRS